MGTADYRREAQGVTGAWEGGSKGEDRGGSNPVIIWGVTQMGTHFRSPLAPCQSCHARPGETMTPSGPCTFGDGAGETPCPGKKSVISPAIRKIHNHQLGWRFWNLDMPIPYSNHKRKTDPNWPCE